MESIRFQENTIPFSLHFLLFRGFIEAATIITHTKREQKMDLNSKETASGIIPIATIIHGIIMNNVGETVRIPITMIRPYKRNPRKNFDENKLNDLAGSLGEAPRKKEEDKRDVEKSVQVTLEAGGLYAELVDGERRLRGAIKAGLLYLSCFIRAPMTDGEKLLSAIRQNLFQEPMTVIEEAHGYRDLMDEYGWSVEEVAKNIGKKANMIKRIMKYLALNKKLQSALLYGKIDKGVALVIAKYKSSEHQDHMLDKLIAVVAERGGKPIHPNEAARICRKEAEILGIVQHKTSRGRKDSSHAQLTARNVLVKTGYLSNALDEFSALETNTLQSLSSPHALEVEDSLKVLQQKIQRELDRLSQLN